MTFKSLLYGNVARGAGYDPDSYGLTFQAMSGGANQAYRDLAKELLFEPLAQQPSDSPASSFRYGTDGHGARGLATGTATGNNTYDGRRGDNVTHALVTSDADDFGSLRPAQLFGSSIWRTELAATRDLDEVVPPLVFDEGFGLDELKDFIVAEPRGPEVLTGMLSALVPDEGTSPKRILLGVDDAGRASRWIAAVTSLLPSERALDVTFQVFADTIGGSTIMAFSPLSGVPAGSVCSQQSFAGFDLISGESNAPPLSAYARFWVPAFIAEDPLDVQEAIELAHRIGGIERAAARSTAYAITFGEPLVDQPGADSAMEILAVVDADGFDEIGSELIGRLQAASRLGFVSTDAVIRQLESLVRLGSTSEADTLRGAVVDALGTHSDTQSLVGLLSPRIGRWASAELRADASARFARIVDAAPDDRAFDLLIAGPLLDLDVDPALAALVPRLAAVLLDDARRYPATSNWLVREAIERATTAMLEQRVGSGDVAALAGLDAGAWQFAIPRATANRTGYPWLNLVVARHRLPTQTPDDRTRASREVLVSAIAGATARAVLWGGVTPRTVDALDWVSTRPDIIADRSTMQWTAAALETTRGSELTPKDGELLLALHAGSADLPDPWFGLMSAMVRLAKVLRDLPGLRVESAQAHALGYRMGREIDPRLFETCTPELAQGIHNVATAGFTSGFLRTMTHPRLLEQELDALSGVFLNNPVEAAREVLEIARTSDLDRAREKILLTSLRGWLTREHAERLKIADEWFSGSREDAEWKTLKDAAARSGGLRGKIGDLLPGSREGR